MKKLVEKWWNKNTKCVGVYSYKDAWDRPHFDIWSNGGKKKNGDNCFTFNINFGYLYFNYINFDLQRKMK